MIDFVSPIVGRRHGRFLEAARHAVMDHAGAVDQRAVAIEQNQPSSHSSSPAASSKPSRFQLCTMCGGSGAVTSIVPPSGCGNDDAPGVQVQPLLDAAGELPVLVRLEIFRIADDRMADMGGVHAQLVGAAGIGLHLEPGKLLPGLLDDAVMGYGMVGARLAMLARRACGRRPASAP